MADSKINVQSVLRGLNKNIDVSLNAVKNIPDVSFESFSLNKFKENVVPILEEAKIRILDIKAILKNIDAVRDEIIKPVDKSIRKSSKNRTLISMFSICIGILGIILTINSYFLSKEDSSITNKLGKSIIRLKEENTKLIQEITTLKKIIENEKQKKEIDTSKQQQSYSLERTFFQKLHTLKPMHQSWIWSILKILSLIAVGILIALSIYFLNDCEEAMAAVCLISSILIAVLSYFTI